MLQIARNQKFKGVFSTYFSSHKFNSNLVSSSSHNGYNWSRARSYSTLDQTENGDPQEEIPKPPAATKVIICGGGLIGTSVAYHLAEFGYKDVVLLTRDK